MTTTQSPVQVAAQAVEDAAAAAAAAQVTKYAVAADHGQDSPEFTAASDHYDACYATLRAARATSREAKRKAKYAAIAAAHPEPIPEDWAH